MANVRLEPPDVFDFRNPDDWPKWKHQFEQCRSASGPAHEEELQRQVSTSLYCLGDVLTSTNITAKQRRNYDTVLVKFDDFFRVRKNVIFERAWFNTSKWLLFTQVTH